MTLHWWMHWFWITLWFTAITGIPLSPRIPDTATNQETFIPKEENEEENNGDVTTSKLYKELEDHDSFSPSSPPPSLPSSFPLTLSRQNFRVPKAIGINPISGPSEERVEKLKADHLDRESPNNLTIVKNDYRVDRDPKRDKTSVLKLENGSIISSLDHSSNRTSENLNLENNNSYNRTSNIASNRSLSLIKKDSKVTWILTENQTSHNEKLVTNEDRRNSSSNDNDDNDDNLAVLPLQEPVPTRFKLVLNRTKLIPSTNINDDKLLNKSEDVEMREDLIESKLLATAASILQGVSESPRLSRARSAFPGDYQQDEQQQQKQDKPSQNGFVNATSSAVDIAAVTGSCLATLVLIGTMGSLGVVMYRRRYMNPPQTLNSDKCSNPDSSGYIDDSTIRDNSEEMYSLDNDSFLNSLEAMTIQNYWTDSVKHTKL